MDNTVRCPRCHTPIHIYGADKESWEVTANDQNPVSSCGKMGNHALLECPNCRQFMQLNMSKYSRQEHQ